MAAQDNQPEISTAAQREPFASLSPAPSSGSRRPTQGGRGRGKAKVIESHIGTETLLTMIQSLADQVSALRAELVASERVSPERQPSAV
jgi:hypothetical protein